MESKQRDVLHGNWKKERKGIPEDKTEQQAWASVLEHQNFEYYLISHRKPAGKRNRQYVGWRERMRGRGDGGGSC